MPQADPETIQKAESVLKLLTSQMKQFDQRQAQDAIRPQDEKQSLPCEMERPFTSRQPQLEQSGTTCPEYTVQEELDVVTVRISLPAVSKVGEIDAEVTDRRHLSVTVPGLYSLTHHLPAAVDDEQMECRFEKSTKTLVVKMPYIS
eukprot:TRINITY_DN5196_c0_g1_i1.p1 TRINITY_DN5196_c0_g1~~TRINITY_DN5196_c0_g1_i1.p1  ORF type:complete len:146 (+),score=35.64 TRINITY_DN5196_c0_g1_i1:542-979(+)